jgi:uncharacterized protein with FMN-binding domain
MRRVTLWAFSTVAALVLLFSYRTSTNASPVQPAAAASAGAKTYTGDVVPTRWGPVQVSIVMSGGRITDVRVPQHPSGSKRNDEINGRALPVLQRATLAAQSADVDTVSGATFTSEGYRTSLQSALDAAHRN